MCKAFDVEAVFLDIEMCINWPTGIVDLGFIAEEQKITTYVHLRRSIYGNVDAALRWLREFTEYLVKECGLGRAAQIIVSCTSA